jgi:hypothetical protein
MQQFFNKYKALRFICIQFKNKALYKKILLVLEYLINLSKVLLYKFNFIFLIIILLFIFYGYNCKYNNSCEIYKNNIDE